MYAHEVCRGRQNLGDLGEGMKIIKIHDVFKELIKILFLNS